jgi:hypothetical protein
VKTATLSKSLPYISLAKYELAVNIIRTVWHVLSIKIINKKNVANPMVNTLHNITRISNGINHDSNSNVDELVTNFMTTVEFISIQINKTKK